MCHNTSQYYIIKNGVNKQKYDQWHTNAIFSNANWFEDKNIYLLHNVSLNIMDLSENKLLNVIGH